MTVDSRTNEAKRPFAVARLGNLETLPSAQLDALSTLTSRLFGVSAAVVSLAAPERQVLVGRSGLGSSQTQAALAWCDHILSNGDAVDVADTAIDPRVLRAPQDEAHLPFRSCLGVALTRPGSTPFGTLCALGSEPRTPRSDDVALLALLASLVVDHLEGLEGARKLEAAHHAAALPERHRAAQEVHAERLASLGLLATGLAHEVNSPLASLHLNLESLGSELADARADLPPARASELEALLEELKDGANRIGQLVSGLQQHTRPDGPPPGPVAVRSLVERAQLISGVHRQPGASVRVSISDRLQVVGRETQLVQVFVNLMLNARHACEDAHEPLSLEVHGRQTEHDVHLTVRDHGPGMAPAVLARATEPFFTTRPDGGGTGLGLYVCEAIVRAHGGDFRLESRPGVGTVAHVHLPATRTLV